MAEDLSLELKYQHPWPSSRPDAYAHQEEVAARVDLYGNTIAPSLIAAVDTAYGHGGEYLFAVAVVLSFPGLEEVERSHHQAPVEFLYHPGLFYYREGPVIVGALTRLQADPDLIIINGHGVAHPRRCGMACHIGVDFDKPSIGCARKLLVGRHRPVDSARGSAQPIMYREREIGLAYRSRESVKPIFISVGHKCDLAYARDIIVGCLCGFRLPEPLRLAHLLANKHKRYIEKGENQKTT